ncbi:MAG: hypothetical protein ACJAS1_006938 [Oleiphilaceae bacterium]|jgi:hypothetical protein
MNEELMRLNNPEYKPITEADLPADRKPEHWLS